MSFDQDPTESVTISGADFAQMVDEIKTLQRKVADLEQVEAWRDEELAVVKEKHGNALIRIAELDTSNKEWLDKTRRMKMTSPIIKNAVNRFLGWPLPDDFAPDGGITFTPPMRSVVATWPTGTHVFTADQARKMFEYALAELEAQPAQSVPDEKTLQDAPMNYDNEQASAWACGFNTCRDSLLQAAPTPANVQDVRNQALEEVEPSTKEVCYSNNGEEFRYAEIADALDSANIGDVIYEGDAIRQKPSHYFDINTMLEQVGESAYDDCGECADDFPNITKSERDELDKIICCWLDAKVGVDFYTVRNVREIVVTQAMLDEHFPADAFASTGKPIAATDGEPK